MTIKETGAIIGWIERLYWRKKDDEARNDLIKLWATIFVDYDAEVVRYAVTQYIKRDQRGYPPMPGQVMSVIEELKSELDVTNRVRKQNGYQRITLLNIVRFRIEDEFGRSLPKGKGEKDG